MLVIFVRMFDAALLSLYVAFIFVFFKCMID